MVTSSSGQWWLCILVFLQILLKTEGDLVNITYVNKAVAKGAVCLDGSPPAYHFDKGFGQGKKNWLLNLEGGAWCNNVTDCIARKSNILGWGSSKLMWTQLNFTGILSNKSYFNPDFYNWNKVKIRYCDGASFTADMEAVDPDTNLYFRGARIFGVVMEELLAKGMKHAKNALLSGCSSGGLAVMFNCDRFRALLPKKTKVKCFSDAGFFLNAKDISGQPRIQEYFNQVVMTHELEKNLPPSCTSKMKAGLCFFPQNVAQNIQTPLFILNPAYDSWQVSSFLVIR
ncbi:unnamed protein product [Ilex paraguariensis]|uniref:Pectin acetylesterase n=1 Tax=Ilex paraguariensis TaxID=185542 RepID=A0ABC8TKD5_9AQUA